MQSDNPRLGTHLHYEAESLLVPLTVAAEIIGLYADKAELRHELGNGNAVARIEALGV
jgi:hypothetical protein